MRRKISTLLLLMLLLFSFSTTAFAANADVPSINGKAAIVIDAATGEIIYEKNIDVSPMYPASTTKLLTALLLAENRQLKDTITYTENAAKQPDYSLYNLVGRSKIRVNDTMTAEDVMKSLLLFSANDSAYMIADNLAGSPAEFANMMNNRIKKMGLKNTHFVTANGLDSDINNHYTSAYDLSIIGREAYKNPWVKQVMATTNDKIEISNGTIAYVENRNKLLGQKIDTAFADKVGINLNEVPASNAIAIGGKTGYTSKAGRCLVTMFEKDGRVLIGVVLKSVYDSNDTYVFNDMARIINWSYAAKRVPLYKANTELKSLTLKYKPLKFFGPEKEVKVPVILKEDATYFDNTVNKKEAKTQFKLSEDIKVNKLSTDNSIGKLVLKEREASRSYDIYPMLSSKEVMKGNTLLYVGIGVGAIVILAVLALIVALISKLFRRKRRNRRMF